VKPEAAEVARAQGMRNMLRAEKMAASFVADSAIEPVFGNATSPIISMGSGKAMAQTYSASGLLGKG
jgi:hypothetical protein